MSDRGAWRGWALLLSVAVLVFMSDQGSKAWVMERLSWGESWSPIPALNGFFSLTLIGNTGAAFGTLKDQGTFLTILALAVVVWIWLYQRELSANERWLRFNLGLMLGGAAGNLADRLRLGYVVDFLDFYFIDSQGVSHHWPAFNLADSAIVLAVLLLAPFWWRQWRMSKPASSHPKGPSPTQQGS